MHKSLWIDVVSTFPAQVLALTLHGEQCSRATMPVTKYDKLPRRCLVDKGKRISTGIGEKCGQRGQQRRRRGHGDVL